jgi:hypothetical protein
MNLADLYSRELIIKASSVYGTIGFMNNKAFLARINLLSARLFDCYTS